MPAEQKQLHQIMHRLQAAPVVSDQYQIYLDISKPPVQMSHSCAASFACPKAIQFFATKLQQGQFGFQGVAAVTKDGEELKNSLTVESIAAAIAKQKKIALDKRLINLQQPITRAGLHDIPLGITLGNGERAKVQLVVSSQ